MRLLSSTCGMLLGTGACALLSISVPTAASAAPEAASSPDAVAAASSDAPVATSADQATPAATSAPTAPPAASASPVAPAAVVPGDIVVTARRRAERLQSVPASISVVTGPALQEQDIRTLVDLGEHTAGLRMGVTGAFNPITIRGVGSGANAGFEQSVATMVDGIYHSRSRSIVVSLFDIDRVEVLKGPQTTFFGANAIAGAINIITKKAGRDFEANLVALGAPTDGEYNLEAGVSVPITDNMAVRAAGRLFGMNGYSHFDRLNRMGPHDRDKQARVSLHWTPGDRLTVDARYDIARLRDKGTLAPELVDCPPPVGAPLGQCARNLALLGSVDDRIDYHTASAVYDSFDTDLDEGAINARLDLGAVSLVSTTGYYRQNVYVIADAAPFPAVGPLGIPTYFPVTIGENEKQFSQELRLESSRTGPFSYMIGGYYSHENTAVANYQGLYLSPIGAAAAPFYNASSLIEQKISARVRSETWSAFASASYDLTDKLTATAGMRYSDVHKEATRLVEFGTGPAIVGEAGFVRGPEAAQRLLEIATGRTRAPYIVPSRTDHAFMPSADVRYKFNPAVMAYASFAHGFKAGGFSSNTPETFRPETVNNYELGLKAQWWHQRLTTNVALFRMDYRDLQESASVPSANGTFVSVVSNAARTRSEGVEFSGNLRLGNFSLGSEVAYTDAHYVDFKNAPCTSLEKAAGACPAGVRDISGRPRPFAPRWSGSVSANYRVGLDDSKSVRLGSTVSFSSFYYTDPSIGPQVVQEGYAKLDLRVAFGPDDGKWELSVIGKNLTNKLTAIRSYIAGAASTEYATPARPRSVAVQGTVRF